MKFCSFILAIILLTTTSLTAQRNYKKGDQLYVLAPSGLNIRNAPSLSGEKVGKALFKDEVEVIGYGKSPQAFSYTGIDGHWLKIDYKGLEGYVFDGLVSRFPISGVKKDIFIPQFIGNNFVALDEPEITKKMVEGFGEFSTVKQTYSPVEDPLFEFQFIEMEEEMIEEHILRLPNMDIAEAFTLGKALDENFAGAVLSHSKGEDYIQLPTIGFQKDRFQSFEYDNSGSIKAVKIHYLHETGSCWMIVRNKTKESVDLVFGCHAD